MNIYSPQSIKYYLFQSSWLRLFNKSSCAMLTRSTYLQKKNKKEEKRKKKKRNWKKFQAFLLSIKNLWSIEFDLFGGLSSVNIFKESTISRVRFLFGMTSKFK